jgi:peptide/nickel transport system permease protein
MLAYITRRLLLMIPTLFGITVMVFLIARLAPGRPGQQQIGAGGISAEEAQALAEWYEKRYGLDLPLWEQYLRWWKGMFTINVQATGWYGDGLLQPVFMYRSPDPEYYVRAPHGRWFGVSDPVLGSGVFHRGDDTFAGGVEPADLARQPSQQIGYAEPIFAIVEARITAIESLQDVADGTLQRATVPVTVTVDAPAWTDDGGEPLYENPLPDDNRPVFRRGTAWYAVTPTLPRENWSVLPITDPGLRTKLRGRDYVDEDDDYVIPRHAVVRGRVERIAGDWTPDQLHRVTVPTQAQSPTGLFMRVPGGDAAVMLWQQVEPVPAMLVQTAQGWQRLIGATRVELPPIRIVAQSDTALRDRLDDQSLASLADPEQTRREPRHAIIDGQLVMLDHQPTTRQIRRYRHETAIFEVALGESVATRNTVMHELRRRLPITLMISLTAFPLIYMIAIPCGMIMATTRGRRFDTGANIVLLGLWSVPTVLAATLLIGYAARGGTGVQWFPNNGLSSVGSEAWPFFQWLGDRVWHLILPVSCIVYGGCAYLAKQMRAAMLDNLTMDYVRTARAKGVPSRDVLFRHVFRNSLLPIITIFATILPVLIAGSIIIEKIFNIEGMGLMAFRAVQNRDYDVVQALAVIAGILNLTGLLIADIAYAIADPRISYR